MAAVHGARIRAARNVRTETPSYRLLTARGLPFRSDTAALGCPNMPPARRATRAALLLLISTHTISAKCLSSDSLEAEFLGITGLEAMPSEGSCCQFDVCGLPCAQPHDPKNPPKFYGRSVAMAIAAFCAIGLIASYYVGDDTTKFFVAGRTLPLPIVVMTLASQCIDANAVLGNADLSYW